LRTPEAFFLVKADWRGLTGLARRPCRAVRKKGATDRKAVDIVTTPYGYYKVQLNGAEKKEGRRRGGEKNTRWCYRTMRGMEMEVEIGYDEASKISRALPSSLAPAVLACPFGGAYEPRYQPEFRATQGIDRVD
jgi:hypothetical protein